MSQRYGLKSCPCRRVLLDINIRCCNCQGNVKDVISVDKTTHTFSSVLVYYSLLGSDGGVTVLRYSTFLKLALILAVTLANLCLYHQRSPQTS